jgi:hypothetical protein
MSETMKFIRRGGAIALGLVIATSAIALAARAMGDQNATRIAASATSTPTCTGSPLETIASPQATVEELGLDGSPSTESTSLREAYEAVALARVNQAASEKAAVRLVAFGASGVGANVTFEGSFAPVSDDDVYNLAAQNRSTCWAKRAIGEALVLRTPQSDGGTDVAGATAALVANARSLVAPGGTATVTVFSDGCQAPSPSGPNRRLTDLCGLLAAGESPVRILKAHAAEFSLGDARGVAITMVGIGIGRNESAANTVFARKLVAFWMMVCKRAHARACQIGSALS